MNMPTFHEIVLVHILPRRQMNDCYSLGGWLYAEADITHQGRLWDNVLYLTREEWEEYPIDIRQVAFSSFNTHLCNETYADVQPKFAAHNERVKAKISQMLQQAA